MTKILVLFTGGTIGSFKVKVNDHYVIGTKTELEKQGISTEGLTQMLIQNYNNVYNINKEVSFDVCEIADVLSENMSFAKWNEITSAIKKQDFSKYDGVIITHGTDTLGYFANYLSMILNKVSVPVFIVSSNYVLDDPRANGNYNFQAACDYIKKIKIPGVYVTFRNTIDGEKKTRVIYGSRVMQCNPLTNDFESITNHGNVPLATVDEFGHIESVDDLCNTINGVNPYRKEDGSLINDLRSLKSNILLVEPYVGLDYFNYNLKKVDAVLHGLYHSGTACTDTDEVNNIIRFNRMVRNSGSDLYVGPFYGKDDKALYASADSMVKAGINFVTNTSKENAYVKLALAYALAPLYANNQDQVSEYVEEFMNEELNHEFINPPIKIKR